MGHHHYIWLACVRAGGRACVQAGGRAAKGGGGGMEGVPTVDFPAQLLLNVVEGDERGVGLAGRLPRILISAGNGGIATAAKSPASHFTSLPIN